MDPFTPAEVLVMTVFDTTLEAPAIQEGNLDPILPEERFIFELVGFERSGPDQFRKNGGIKWTFNTWNEDGTPFDFQDEQYQLWRTTNINANGEPLFNIGTQAHEWACALLGRQLGVEEKFSVSELRNRRMSAMVVWRNKRPPAKGKTFDLASLRHVPVGSVNAGRGGATTSVPPPSGRVTADATDDDISRALVITKIRKSLKTLKALDAEAGASAQKAVDDSDLDEALLDDLNALSEQISTAVRKAMDA
jgi:hypothetical protein